MIDMSKWMEQQTLQKEVRERDKTRREKLAGFFFDLAKLCFAGLVIGGITPLIASIPEHINWLTVVSGILITCLCALTANKILK